MSTTPSSSRQAVVFAVALFALLLLGCGKKEAAPVTQHGTGKAGGACGFLNLLA